MTFVNSSSTGETWLWNFGDRKVSTSKSPAHTYDAPGTYQVVLKVDDKDSQTCTHVVTVVDTVPTYVCNHDTLPIYVFEDVLFSAMVFNPNNDSITCNWTAQPACAVTVDSTGKKWKVYFTKAGEVEITMRLTLNGITTTQTRTYSVVDKKGTAVLMKTADNRLLRQRVFIQPTRTEEITTLTYPEGMAIIDAIQDTLQEVNGYTYRLNELKTILPQLEGFRIAYGKIYFRTVDGLYVSDVKGENINMIDPRPISALYTDTYTGINRLYWATQTGVYYMPLVDHPLNQFDNTKIKLLNDQSDIIRIAVDTIARLR